VIIYDLHHNNKFYIKQFNLKSIIAENLKYFQFFTLRNNIYAYKLINIIMRET